MSFIAAVLLLNMDVDDAFCCFANLLNRPCQIAFFRLDESLVRTAHSLCCLLINRICEGKSPRVLQFASWSLSVNSFDQS